MGVNTTLIIVAAVTVALAAGMVAFRFVAGNRGGQEPGEVFGMSRTKVAIKLIVLGLAAFIGLLVFYLYEKGGG